MSEQTSLAETRVTLGSLTFGADWPALVDAARRARDDHPQAWEPEYYEARALTQSGRYEDAQHLLLLAMDRFPGNAMLAVLYGQIADQGPDHESAIARWLLMLQRLPQTAQLHLGLARALVRAGRLNEADDAFAAGSAQAPRNVQLAAGRAALALQRRDWAAALHGWAAVGDMRHDHPDVVPNMMLSLRRMGKLDEADLLAREAISDNPDDVAIAVGYAENAVQRGDFAEAALRWATVLERAPENLPAANGLAQARARAGDRPGATRAVKAALMQHPRDEQLLTFYATLATLDREWPEAVARWSEVHRKCRPRAGMYVSYIDALAQAGRFADADAVAAEALDFAPGEELLLQRYAQIAMRRGAYDDALHRWHQAERHFPGSQRVIDGIHAARAALHQIGALPTEDAPVPGEVPAEPESWLAAPAASWEPLDAPLPVPIETAPAQRPAEPVPVVETPAPEPAGRTAPPTPPAKPYEPPAWASPAPALPPREPPAWAIQPPDRPVQMPQTGVTALDLLMGAQATGATAPPAPRPPAPGFASKLRRIFGKSD